MPEESVVCRDCGLPKAKREFRIARVVGGKTYFRRKCKQCHNKVKQARRVALRKVIEEFKRGATCERCGFADIRCLQFHHPDDNKEFDVGGSANFYGVEKIMAEMKKCKLLCANCHIILHHDRP